MLSKLNGWKTYASSIATVIVVVLLWKQGASVDTMVAVGIMGISGGFAGIRHALTTDAKTIDPATMLDMVEKLAKDKGEHERIDPRA